MNAPFLSRINAEDYIKRGDTDETAGIQRAIDVASALAAVSDGYGPGVKVVCPAGNWRLSQTLQIRKSYVSLVGDGAQQSRFSRSTDYGDTVYIAPEDLTTAVYQAGNSVTGIGMFHAETVPTHGAHIHHAACTKFKLVDTATSGHFGGVDIESSNAFRVIGLQAYADFAWWTTLVPGSSLIRFRENSSVLGYKPPTEGFISDFNIKGGCKGAGAFFLDKAILIEGGDGIQFSNGHAGFAASSCLIQPSASNVTVQSIFLSSVYLDGGFGGGSGLVVYNPNGGGIRAIQAKGGQMSNHTGIGAYINPGADKGTVTLEGVEITNNGSHGVQLASGSGHRVNGNVIRNNATTVSGATQICVSSTYDTSIEGNLIGREGTATPAVPGINFAGPNDRLIVTGNNFRGNSVDLANTGNQGASSVVGNNTTAP